jgi:hypothetical protein
MEHLSLDMSPANPLRTPRSKVLFLLCGFVSLREIFRNSVVATARSVIQKIAPSRTNLNKRSNKKGLSTGERP